MSTPASAKPAPVNASAGARVVLKRIDPWTTARTAFVVSLALGVAMLVAFMLLWVFLAVTGVFDAILGTLGDIFASGGGVSIFSFLRALGSALIVVAMQVLAMTVGAGLYAVIYNLTVKYTGGIRVNLAQE